MEYNSFYGGRKGASFIIVTSYKSVPEMCQQFRKGGNYITVNYDEYVLINTDNKNHPDNGKVFRRGYDYNSGRKIDCYTAKNATGTAWERGTVDAGGAIYVGTIVGPSGNSPWVNLTTYSDAQNKQAGEGFEKRAKSGEYTKTASNLVPGKYMQGTSKKFNDSIKWYCTSIRDTNGLDTQAYIGFTIPYPVIDFTTGQVKPYDSSGNAANMTAATRTDDGTHPFYEEWKISVPHGIKGDTIKDFRVITPKSTDNIYTFGTTTKYPGLQDDIASARRILVYDYYNYDQKENPTKVTYYIGDYNQITSFTLDNNGNLKITFSHQDAITYKLSWVKGIKIAENGEVTLQYTGGKADTKLDTNLQWVKSIDCAANGTVTVTYNNGNTSDFSNAIKWVTNLNIDTTNGDQRLKVTYNNGTSAKIGDIINNIDRVALDEEHHLLVYYTSATKRNSIAAAKKRTYDEKSDWEDLGSVWDYAHSGILVGMNLPSSTFSGNTSQNAVISYLDEHYKNGLSDYNLAGKIITVGDNDDNKVFYAYDYNKKGWYYIGAAGSGGGSTDCIDTIAIDPSDYHLLAYYALPAKRNAIPASKKRTYDGKTDWEDLGSIDNETLKTDVSGLKTDVSTLKTNVNNAQGDITTIKTNISNAQGDISTLKTDVSGLKTDVGTLKNKIDKLHAATGKTTTDTNVANLQTNGLWFVVQS